MANPEKIYLKKILLQKHYCYLIINKINNKVYVGTTYMDIKERFKIHIKTSRFKNENKKNAIHRAIAKYGKENFIIKLLKKFNNGTLAYKAEIKYIKNFKSNNNKYGYNESLGGDRGPIIIRHDSKVVINIIKDFCNDIPITDIARKYNMICCL